MTDQWAWYKLVLFMLKHYLSVHPWDHVTMEEFVSQLMEHFDVTAPAQITMAQTAKQVQDNVIVNIFSNGKCTLLKSI